MDELFQDPAVDPVLCSPYEEPDRHWQLDEDGRADRTRLPLRQRREPLRISVPADAKATGQGVLRLSDRESNGAVLAIREAVGEWRANGYEGAETTSRRLLWHWTDPQSMRLRPFFAQVEAIETLIWLREVATRATRARRDLEEEARKYNDGIVRLCSKMATGTGKTAVMGMLIAWQTLNAIKSKRTRNLQHTNKFVVLAPGHTVRQRLGVLVPSSEDNVYDEMGLVPHDLRSQLNRARVRIFNYQAFTQKDLIVDTDARKLLGKAKGEDIESWGAAVRRVVGDIADGTGSICVINDEAHHCYLPKDSTGQRRSREDKDEDARAAVWFNAIRAMRDQGLLGKIGEHGQEFPVYDFSATPLWIDTSHRSEPEQFQWVVSDFGLMEAIESGLVKVPRVPIDDDSTRDETVWRKLYENTQSKDLAKWLASENSSSRLPEALHGAVQAVAQDWERKLRVWEGHPLDGKGPMRQPQPTPPVIIFVANKISNATALWKYIAGDISDAGEVTTAAFPELSNLDENGQWLAEPRTLLVHSKIGGSDTVPDPLKKMLVQTAGLGSKADAEEAVREMLNTVGKPGRAGAQVRCVISVGMLTEGWDARTVTHIVGFRAFGTQLLCEQVTGRALRRTSYDAFRQRDGKELLEAEYADVVGIPFEFMPSVAEPTPPGDPKPRTRVRTVPGRHEYRVGWPQAIEYIHVAEQGRFDLDSDKITAWSPPQSTGATITIVEGAAGEAGYITSIDEDARPRTALVELAAAVTAKVSAPDGLASGQGKTSLFISANKAVKKWVSHPDVDVNGIEGLKEILADSHHRQAAIEAVLEACNFHTDASPRCARLASPPICDTARIDFETTLSHIAEAEKSELSHAACHSNLELRTATELDRHPKVQCWVRNFQLGWTIPYWRDGVWARYEPDFIAVLACGTNLVVECKGVWDHKARQAAEYTEQHWIPSIAGTTSLPDHLRQWAYTVIDDPNSIRHQLDLAIRQATERQQ